MKNIGSKLQAAREERGLSIDDAARETNIARKYIAALEAEDFSPFPAEAYVLGFLKNYGDYLGLDTADLHSQYKVLKIQEQPVPVNELLNKPSHLPRVFIALLTVLGSVALAGGAVYFFINLPKAAGSGEAAVRKSVVHSLSDGLVEQRFFVGDAIVTPSNNGEYRIELSNIGEVITLASPQGNIVLGLNQDAVMDVNEDGFAELRVHAADYAQNKPEMGALLRFEVSPETALTEASAENTPQDAAETAAETAASAASVSAGNQVVFSSNNPYPFTLDASFQRDCMFRWQILRETGQKNRDDDYFTRGQTKQITAQNGIRLWMSNAGAVKMQVIGGGRTVALETGQAVVYVADLQWTRGENGRWNLMFERLEN
ncbi:MAG: helix-turn-helix domain-containing protein [Spirochaetaceae bacterium]|jgi:cytoskeletal protein RodZ|nr:helix-turn-helix domain-containing protein [Spirochaetaceae bacterium]